MSREIDPAGRQPPSVEDDLRQTALLIEGASRGDPDCVEEVLRRYYPTVAQIVRARTGQALLEWLETEDIVQETLLDAVRNLDSFQFRTQGSFRNWLAQIVENNIREARRNQRALKRGGERLRRVADLKLSSLSESIFGRTLATPSQDARQEEQERLLHEAISTTLEGPYREVVVLRSLCQMPFREVAEKMGYSKTSTVRAMHSRAVQRLRECLGEQD